MSIFNSPSWSTVTTEDELRKLVGYPSERVSRKAISSIDSHCRQIVAMSPMAFISTSDASGRCDVSPRGDAPGFVRVWDDKRLLIPERPGNRRMDSLLNIVSNPHIGIVFIVPGLGETLRVNGRASIVNDEALLLPLEAQGKVPQLAIMVEVEECYIHCAKAFLRSKLWEPGTWPDLGRLPSPGQIIVDHAKVEGVTTEDVNRSLKESYEKRLY